jgi:hypothetical protein
MPVAGAWARSEKQVPQSAKTAGFGMTIREEAVWPGTQLVVGHFGGFRVSVHFYVEIECVWGIPSRPVRLVRSA